ncbi:hypothetical protein [Paraburkholderia caribensis]|nr:hypothetical protein [Paraburkholderia caribensis]
MLQYDRNRLEIDSAVFSAIPDIAFPVTRFGQFFPECFVERFILSSGIEKKGREATRFFL